MPFWHGAKEPGAEKSGKENLWTSYGLAVESPVVDRIRGGSSSSGHKHSMYVVPFTELEKNWKSHKFESQKL